MKQYIIFCALLCCTTVCGMKKAVPQLSITQVLQAETKEFIIEGGSIHAAPKGLEELCKTLVQKHEFYLGQSVTAGLGKWKGVDFSIGYTGCTWIFYTRCTFFKGELHDPELACLPQEKKTLWYKLLQACASKRDVPFPIILDGVTKLADVLYVKKNKNEVYDDEYAASFNSVFSSECELLAFIRGNKIVVPQATNSLDALNIDQVIVNGAVNSLSKGKKIYPSYQGVSFRNAEQRGLCYIDAILSVPCEEWRDPAEYLVEIEKTLLYGKLLLAFHAKAKEHLMRKEYGPHILSDKVKGILRPQDKSLIFEYLGLSK